MLQPYRTAHFGFMHRSSLNPVTPPWGMPAVQLAACKGSKALRCKWNASHNFHPSPTKYAQSLSYHKTLRIAFSC
eukprot:3184666-Amphidinium_carterae.1